MKFGISQNLIISRARKAQEVVDSLEYATESKDVRKRIKFAKKVKWSCWKLSKTLPAGVRCVEIRKDSVLLQSGSEFREV